MAPSPCGRSYSGWPPARHCSRMSSRHPPFDLVSVTRADAGGDLTELARAREPPTVVRCPGSDLSGVVVFAARLQDAKEPDRSGLVAWISDACGQVDPPRRAFKGALDNWLVIALFVGAAARTHLGRRVRTPPSVDVGTEPGMTQITLGRSRSIFSSWSSSIHTPSTGAPATERVLPVRSVISSIVAPRRCRRFSFFRRAASGALTPGTRFST